jgi:hypothetical protein
MVKTTECLLPHGLFGPLVGWDDFEPQRGGRKIAQGNALGMKEYGLRSERAMEKKPTKQRTRYRPFPCPFRAAKKRGGGYVPRALPWAVLPGPVGAEPPKIVFVVVIESTTMDDNEHTNQESNQDYMSVAKGLQPAQSKRGNSKSAMQSLCYSGHRPLVMKNPG